MPSTDRLRTLLAQTGSFALAALLLWLALRGVELEQVGRDLARGDYRWLAPLVAVMFAAHLARAWRWRVLLEGLPDARLPSLGEAFGAVMMGYGVNYVLPRAGEVVRTGVVSRRTGTPFAAVFGTVVLDRILDMGLLALGLLTVPLLMRDRLDALSGLFLNPLQARLGTLPLGAMAAALLVLVALGGVWWRRRRTRTAAAPQARAGRLRTLARSFSDGLKALARTRKPGALVGSTVFMWGMYVLMAFLPFLLLRTASVYSLSIVDAWCIMMLGALGLVVPSPGGAGSFHYITILTLTQLWGVGREDAAAYAVLSHAAQLVVYVITGALCFLLFTARRPRNGQPDRTVARARPDVSGAGADASRRPDDRSPTLGG